MPTWKPRKRVRGWLHKALHVPPDRNFIKRELLTASHSDNKLISARAKEALHFRPKKR